GIIPGAGGTQRMPRLIGIESTLDMVVNAVPVSAQQGLELGFIDHIAEGDLETAARDYLMHLIADDRAPRPTSQLAVDPATAKPEVIEKYRELAHKKYPNRHAAMTAIEAVSAAVRLPFEEGLDYET